MSLDRFATPGLRPRVHGATVRCLAIALALAASPPALQAGGDSATLLALAQRPLLTVEAESIQGSARFELIATDFRLENGTLTWVATAPVRLRDAVSGIEIGVLESASVTYVADPVVAVSFQVSSAVPTNFTLTSASLGFDPIDGAQGRASVALTVTDADGSGPTLAGLEPGGQPYQAFYNDVDEVPASGASFATLGTGLSNATPYTSPNVAEDFPPAPGLSATAESGAVLGTVTSMSTRFSFQLGGGDFASGTSVFFIEPPVQPESLSLTLESGGATATLDLPLATSRSERGSRVWSSREAAVLRDPGTGAEIGRLEPGSVVWVADHFVALGFSVTTGESPSNFTITSASISFAAAVQAFGRASAALTVTDLGGDGATLAGGGGDGQVYQAFYNDVGGVAATGASFVTLLDGVSVPTPYSSATLGGELGAAGSFSAVAEGGAVLGSVSSMSVRVSFSLSAQDSASGTTVFAIQPGGMVGGRVYLDSDGNGAQGVGEPGLAGVDVAITDSQSGIQVATTDANGDYSRAVPAGSTSLDVDPSTLPAGALQTQGTDPTLVVVPAGGSANDVDGYQLQGGVAVTVYVDTDGDGARDPGEPGLVGVDILVTDSLAAAQNLTTDANGEAAAAVPPGTTTVDVVAATVPAGLVLSAGSDPAVVAVAAGEVTAVAFGYRFLSLVEIPTLGEVGLLLLALGLGLGGARQLRRGAGRTRAD